jgi:hypothetical protein
MWVERGRKSIVGDQLDSCLVWCARTQSHEPAFHSFAVRSCPIHFVLKVKNHTYLFKIFLAWMPGHLWDFSRHKSVSWVRFRVVSLDRRSISVLPRTSVDIDSETIFNLEATTDLNPAQIIDEWTATIAVRFYYDSRMAHRWRGDWRRML